MNNHHSEKGLLKRTAKLEKELAAKNHELEVEAALEKVRTVAIGMRKPGDLLEVCKVLFKQLLSIGFVEIRNAMINIHNDADKTFVNYDYSDQLGKSTNHLTYSIHPLIERQIKKIRSTRDAFSETYFAGNDLAEWKRFRKKVGEKDDPRLTKNKGLYYYLYSIGLGSIGISTFGKISKEKKALLKRFRNVFDLSYQRYVDIARAEAQAREAKIEAALEKIRSRSLAMHQSKELRDVISVTFEKLSELKVLHGTVAIQLFDRQTKNSVMWVGNTIQDPQMVNLPYDRRMMLENTYLKDGWKAMMSGVDIINKEYSFVEKNKFFKYIFSRNDLTQIPENAREVLRQIRKYSVCLFTEKNSALFVDSFSGESFSKEDMDIIKRTGKVFEQAYIRFLDLQKAEAQAREAQIEAALERVRSRAMAMQTSEELNALIGTVFTELTKLDLVLTRCVILIYEDNKKGVRWWMANSEAPSMPMDFFVKYADMPFFNEYLKGWQERSLKWQYVLEGENKFNTDEFLFRETQLSQLPDFVIAGMRAPDRVYLNASFNNFGNLTLASLEPLSDEHFDILLRFAKVFDLTYTRFNDLQKAEAQAREAQIETALERVRSRTMAMHQTAELQEVIHTVHNELLNLHLSIDGGSFVVINDDVEPELRCWGSGGTANTSEEVHVPHFNMPFCTNLMKGIKKGPGFFTEEFSHQDKKKYFTKLFKHKPWSDLSSEQKKLTLSSSGGYTRSVAVSKHTTIFIINHHGRKFTEAENDILKRFSKVFEQTYTRFLDLQKAEAQARESQIQLALERVRARTMAMQHSNELGEAASLLFKQISDLGIQTWTSGFNIWQSDGNSFIGYNPTPSGGIAAPYIIPSKEDNFFKKIYQAKEAGEDFIVFEWKEGPLAETYSYMKTLPIVKEVLKGIELSGFQLPTFQINHCVFFAQGFLLFITLEPYPEAHDIFKRFGRVFEQTYTRFLDLQKAEAQARESQIQLALERVRARTMAMQKSDELAEAAQVLYEEFKTLNINTFTCGYLFIKEDQHKQTAWVTLPDGTLIPDFIDFPLTGDHVLDKRYEDWKQKKPLHVFEIQGEANKEHHRFLASTVPDQIANEIFAQIPDRIIFYCANFSAGYLFIIATEFLSSEEEEIIVRFAKVFELTYTRFSDLKQAEKQAREAQIEASLERVRARTMAMHKSQDLLDVITILSEQFKLLGFKIDSANFNTSYREKDWNLWLYNPGSVMYPDQLHIPYFDHPYFNRTLDALAKGEDFNAFTFSKEEKDRFLDHLYTNTLAKNAPEERKSFTYEKPGFAWSVAYSKNTAVTIANYDAEPYTAEQNIILRRFANVFEQTYTRFLDLKKAEHQAREAQIEAALERVRSRSMAMHQSSDLHEVVKVVTEQLTGLGIKFNAANFARIHSGGDWDLWISAPDQAYPAVLEVPYIDHGLFNNIIEAIKKGHDFVADAYDQQQKNIFFKHFFENTLAKHTPDARKEWVMSCKGFARSVFLTRNIWLAVSNYDGVPFSNEENAIFKRFANAFEQTYTRFLDLQKAEANAREAQIEASLERVRSKTMAMHNSDDVGETVATMFAEFVHLDIRTNRCGILIFDDEHTVEVWTARSTLEGNAKLIVGKLDLDAHKMLRSVYNAWRAKEEFYQYDLIDNDLLLYYTAINNSKFYPTQFDLKALPSKEFHSDFFFADGAVFSFTNEPVVEEHSKIMKRFAGVFGQTYRRYLDLQKAEAQAREAQIEASLERVRAKAMAMHNSEDLAETIKVFYQQLDSLKLMPRRCGVGLINKDTRIAELTGMVINELGESKEIAGKLILKNHPILENIYNGWLRQEDYYPVLRGNEIKKYYQLIGAQIAIQNYPDDAVQFGYFFSFPEGQVYAWTEKEFTEDELKIYRRFTSVLSLTYKRYKDLKQAEAQAKEAKIEAGLERVRARTMAMHTSDDVSAATATMFTELEKLGIENFRGGITNMLPNRTQHVWSVNNLAEGKVVKAVGAFNMDDHPFWQRMYGEWQAKNDFTHYFLAGQEKEDYVKILNSTQGYLTRAIENFPDVHFQVYFFNEGGVWTNSLHAHTDEEQQIMKRFTSVFSLTFRRYQDLRKAEAQAREATIEAALEKVRGKAMAMHDSSDLSATASMVFTELRKLGINPIRCGVGLLNKESRKAQLYSAASSADGDSLSLIGWVILSEHPVLEKIYETWLNNEEYYPELQGEQMRLYYEQLLKGLPVTAPTIEADKKQYGHFLPFSVGCLYAWSETSYDDSEIKILKRFATIIDLTFRRYMELQQSEANAREAVKQAALDRIRADIASMRKVEDLDRITPLIWNELTILGLPFIRCGIFLMDDSQRLLHTFLSTPEGKAIAAFHMPYNVSSKFDEVVDNWRHKKIFVDHWTEPDFVSVADTLVKQGAITDREQYIRSLPTGGFYLHFIPFLQGMLYVGNFEKLGEEEMSLIESVADAFSTAYARYEDFNRLEAAKQQVEKTLTDLKQAQTQLVQSEKMASLGELTAGIAHEIQNPLNFVNNFSEVSNELIEELKIKNEKLKIEDDEVSELLNDIAQNLEKINFHGKRADAIVKGMLQHSRTSSGQKELTDINALADEYLRLAFHGLRAKDKSFNAKFETHFDENVGKIDIIQQDIGRVILNLINNAFYAVSEKKKHPPNARLPDGQGYEPTVTLTTTKDNGKIEVKVKDNGNGIPGSIVDKIFQPFFTTKPTGQGTGLGLSLAYDIVKAHGGDIRVETKEGEGSEFIVELPVKF